jgi:hypothetical protein
MLAVLSANMACCCDAGETGASATLDTGAVDEVDAASAGLGGVIVKGVSC